ncbi:MAG TPA: alpha/beta hydrolase-fold protein [Rhodothermales bacterium]|nr:alpha/beta hydrolase-fold protein [Rhodothermales bacterium]
MTQLEQLETLRSEPDPAKRTQLVDALWNDATESGTPLIPNDTTLIFLYRGPGERVRVSGDMTHSAEEIVLERISDTDLFVGTMHGPSDALFEYSLLIDDNFPVADQMNPYKVGSGFGYLSEVAMPDFEYHPALIDIRDGTLGGYDRVTQHTVPAGIMGYEKEIHVYTPPGYDDAEADYPTVYIQDGRDYIEFGHTPAVIDWLIERDLIEPFIAVFISPPNRHGQDQPNRATEYGLNPDYPQWMADDLVPFVESLYRVRKDPSQRMVAGDSFAGLVSVYIPFERPDVFGIGYGQSGYVSLNRDTLIERYATEETRPIRLYVDVGVFEHAVGKDWFPDYEINFTEGNRRFRDVLESKGYEFVYREYLEGHNWGNWRRHLIDAFQHFFPAKHD